MASGQVKLSVNEVPIQLDHFVQVFIDRVIKGMLSALRGTQETQTVELSIKGDIVSLTQNSVTIPVNPFTAKIIKNTVIGLVSSLKGVSHIERLDISIE